MRKDALPSLLKPVNKTRRRKMSELTDDDKREIMLEATRNVVNAARKRLRAHGYRNHDDVTPEETPHLFVEEL